MPVKVEIINPFFTKKEVGSIPPGNISPFANYTPEGDREILVLDCKKDDSKTVIYRANPEIDEIDISEIGIDEKNYEKLATLERGQEFFIEASKNRYGQTRMIRFTQE